LRADGNRYSEAVPLLYTAVHFHFPHPADILYFSNTVLTSAPEPIQFASVDWEDARLACNAGCYKAIGKMTNLKEVRVFIKDLLITLHSPRLRGMLGTIKNIRVSGTFELWYEKIRCIFGECSFLLNFRLGL
jgi:hypothetical protein